MRFPADKGPFVEACITMTLKLKDNSWMTCGKPVRSLPWMQWMRTGKDVTSANVLIAFATPRFASSSMVRYNTCSVKTLSVGSTDRRYPLGYPMGYHPIIIALPRLAPKAVQGLDQT